jgi:hypothetical protein
MVVMPSAPFYQLSWPLRRMLDTTGGWEVGATSTPTPEHRVTPPDKYQTEYDVSKNYRIMLPAVSNK